MAHTTIQAAPFVEGRPSFVINFTGGPPGDNGIQLQCALASISHQVDQQFVSVETYCAEGAEAPGLAVHSFAASFRQSYDTTGLYLQLVPLFRQLVTFAFLPQGDQPVSETNPELSGQLYVPTLPMYEGSGPGQSLTSAVTFNLFGAPAFTVDPLTAVTTHPT